MAPFAFETFETVGDSLHVAGGKGTPKEAYFRSSVGRFYYAAFHLASTRVPPGTSQARNSHDAVWKFLKEHGDESLRRAGKAGLDLRDLRVIADYQQESLPSNWELQSTHAKGLLATIEKHLS